ncbi:MAG: acetolactate synthase large subunit [Syntrophales bacterium]|jgi:acetolactate synthase-1/2/3 large subunit|nr:acetolactate synthase large subunit [Syntrophales bacterium]
MKASDLFVRQLEEEGVLYIFGLPGEENLDLIESIRNSSIKFIVTRHEQAAAFMAATHGRLTGRAGVCLSTLGPGATNLVTGIAHGQLIGAPIISISGQKALRHNRQGKFQLVDIVSMMKPITKMAVSIMDADMIPTIIRSAFKTAEQERPGAVHIEFPEDLAGERTDAAIQKRQELYNPAPDQTILDRAAKMIRQASTPLIFIAGGANRPLISRALFDFIQQTGIYVVHTQMGKGIIPDDCSTSLFATGIHLRDYVHCGMDRADLVITVGYHPVEYPPSIWNDSVNRTIIHIGFAPSDTDPNLNPDLEIIGDIATTIRELGKRLPEKRSFPVFAKTRAIIQSKIDADILNTWPPPPQTIVRKVRETLGRGDILALDNGIYKLWFSRLYPTYESNTLLLDNALATMGAGLPTALAAKMLAPEKKVLAVCGDGGFMINSQELETLRRCDLPLVILILNDNAFGFIKWKQRQKGFPPFVTDYGNPDFVRYAESFGITGYRIKRGDDLAAVLSDFFASDNPAVIECPVDYSVNYDTFSVELGNLVCQV